MKPTTQFLLETLDVPYEQRPSHSQLFVDGKPTSLRLPGYSLLYQFDTQAGFLLVTDYDSPYEETPNFILLSHDLRVVSRRSLGPGLTFIPNASYLLKNIEWVDDWHFVAILYGEDSNWLFTIRKWGIPYLRPRLTTALVHKRGSSDRPHWSTDGR